MTEAAELLVERDDDVGIAQLTLNRPGSRNALNARLWQDLAAQVTTLDADETVRVVILTGADPAFCAGFDLQALSSEDRGAQQRRQDEAPSFLGMLPQHDTPVIGAVNGAAVTGGLELALACDWLLASEHARFADTHARVGLLPGGGLTIRLPELIGPARALQMSLTGDFVDAETALRWGLVNEVVPHDQLLPRARQLAGAVAGIAPEPLVGVRRLYAEVAEQAGGDAAWRYENERARAWMRSRFDQARLAAQRERIMERGRSQQHGTDA